MIIEVGNMWDAWDAANLFLFTANGVVDKKDRLVMGGGIALQTRNRFPEVDHAIGRYLRAHSEPQEDGIYRFGLLVSPTYPSAKLGAFQSKLHYRNPSTMNIINYSISKLREWCSKNPEAQVHLNWPGVGLGGLTHRQTLLSLYTLPDTVHVWTDLAWWQREHHKIDAESAEGIAAIRIVNELTGSEPDDYFGTVVEIHADV
jgi:hypothetical protein